MVYILMYLEYISVSGHETRSTGQFDVLLFLPRVRFTQNIQFLHKIECIKFECNEFVLDPSLSPYRQTNRQTDRQRVKLILVGLATMMGSSRLILVGLGNLQFLQELFFLVVLLCQFLVLAGNRFCFYILMYLEYNTVMVLC